MRNQYDIIVVGGGHAGLEASWAAANLGARVGLVTLDPTKIGVMSCNPAIGGLAKGQIVREIDALGGMMGVVTDKTGVMFKTLNSSRGPAVRGPRAQCDKHAYAETARAMATSRDEITILAGAVEEILLDGTRVRGALMRAGDDVIELLAPAVVLTTGTFMRGLMHRGQVRTPGGRVGEAPAVGISAALEQMGFELGRLKTGTPPRLRRSTIDWDGLDAQLGDSPPTPFSEMTNDGVWNVRTGEPGIPRASFPAIGQLECRITRTTAEAHEAIRANLHRAPLYNGQLDSTGPRYCPSIEDKIVRFPDRESHHVFLEPESHRDESVYCNGISSSLPDEVQQQIVHLMPGCERAEILRYGYAVEYDMVRPHQIDATCMTKRYAGFFLAGQINGTTGYEEAAGQGLLAGLNAAKFASGESLVTLGREEAYIGVMMDDLVTKTPTEPYRMFTSRAEHRLTLRADNAADRLTEKGRTLGLIDDHRWERFTTRRREVAHIDTIIEEAVADGRRLRELVKQPHFGIDDLVATIGTEYSRGAALTALAERQYAGYIARQQAETRRQADMEHRRIPGAIQIESIPGLRAEAREALAKFQPATIGQAGRLEGVNPADVSLLLVAMRRRAQRSS